MTIKNTITEHYKKFFDLHAKGIALDEDDHLNIDWAESLLNDVAKSQKSAIPIVSQWVAVSESEPDLGEVIECYDPEPLEGMMDRHITTYKGLMPSGTTHWKISRPPFG